MCAEGFKLPLVRLAVGSPTDPSSVFSMAKKSIAVESSFRLSLSHFTPYVGRNDNAAVVEGCYSRANVCASRAERRERFFPIRCRPASRATGRPGWENFQAGSPHARTRPSQSGR